MAEGKEMNQTKLRAIHGSNQTEGTAQAIIKYYKAIKLHTTISWLNTALSRSRLLERLALRLEKATSKSRPLECDFNREI